MSKLLITGTVKFRAFGITFGTVPIHIVVSEALPISPHHIFTFDDRGVHIEVDAIPA
jgi:hypothetical protein